jgi:hypothetical protein
LERRERARRMLRSIGVPLKLNLKTEEFVDGLGVFDGLLHLFVPGSDFFSLMELC